jgi:hypothetical protein
MATPAGLPTTAAPGSAAAAPAVAASPMATPAGLPTTAAPGPAAAAPAVAASPMATPAGLPTTAAPGPAVAAPAVAAPPMATPAGLPTTAVPAPPLTALELNVLPPTPPVLAFASPELTGVADPAVAGPDRDRLVATLSVAGGRDDMPALAAADLGGSSQRAKAVLAPRSLTTNPAPTSAHRVPPVPLQPPASFQSTGPDVARAMVGATDRKNGQRAADEADDTDPRVMSGESKMEQTAAPLELFSMPSPTDTVTTAPAHPTSTATPAAQITPALVTLARTADGSQQMTVRLHPAELGMVQIRIERAASGVTQIDITSDEPETLRALQRDQPALHRTLDDAGIPAAGRTVNFHTVQPAAPSASSGSSGSGQGSGPHPPAGRTNHGGTDTGGSAGGGRGGYPTRETHRWPGARVPAASPDVTGATAPADPRTYRIGLDITA